VRRRAVHGGRSVSRTVRVRKGAYADSVTLMQVSQQLAARSDVTSALVAMATDLNLQMMSDMGFEPPRGAAANDLVVAIELADTQAEEAVLSALEELLVRPPSRSSTPIGIGEPTPPTVGAAARRGPATLALVSTPGPVATLDAADALASGLDVMLFSDNVAVASEISLKELAAQLGKLVMGPDCGTAVVNGVGLGFANVVRPGPVGMVAASGTGAQQLLSLLDGCDVGVSSCLGVGGRDLSADVGGRSTLTALDRLAADDGVTTIVVVSKPPSEQVADLVTQHAESLGKPVVLGYLGVGRPDLTAVAEQVVRTLGVTWHAPRRWGSSTPAGSRRGFLRGLFSGGTLCDEAMLLAVETLAEVSSNIPLAGQPALESDLGASGHTFIDFGDDTLTAGRPHPMIDPSLRAQRLAAELRDPDCAAVLLDVVLGYGAHPDPATEIAAVISASDTPVVVSLIGTRDDPQGLESTADRLVAAGATVHASNAAAAREAVALVRWSSG
jgi:FdrA protein